MALPVSPNSISMSQVNAELGLTATATISLNDSAVRSLFGIASGTISLGDGRGKANISPATNLVLSGIGQTGAIISWTASASPAVTYYTVFVTDATPTTVFTQTFNTLPLPTTADITGLNSNTPYTVHVLTGNATASVDATIPLTTTNFDTTPDVFTFTAVTGAIVNTPTPSSVITVTGLQINYGIIISVTGGQYAAGTTAAEADSAVFTSTSDTYITDSSGNLYVKAQLTSSASFSTAKTCTVTVGSRNGIFAVTTAAPNTTPANFSFTPVTGIALSTAASSAVTTADGLSPNIPISISVVGGSYGAGTTLATATSAAFTTTAGTYTTDSSGVIYVKARVTASSSYYTNTSATVTVGSGTAQFIVTSIGDTIPTAFTIPEITAADLSTNTTSAVVTVSGLSPLYPVPVSITAGGSYDAADAVSNLSGTFISTASTVTTDATGKLFFQVQLTSSASNNTAVTTTITVGSGTAIFSVRTVGDVIPTAFTFAASTSTTLNPTKWTINNETLYGASPIWTGVTTVSGLGASIPIPITWNNADATIMYGTSSSTISNSLTSSTQSGTGMSNSSGNMYLQIAVPAPAKWTSYSLDVTIGGVTGTFTAKTAPSNPNAWDVAALTDVYRGTIVYSDVATVSGMTPGFNGWGSGTTRGMYVGVVSGTGKYFASNSASTTSGAGAASYKTTVSYVVPDDAGNIYIKLQQTASTSAVIGTAVVTTYRVGYSSVGAQDYAWSVATPTTTVETALTISNTTGTANAQGTGPITKVTLTNGASLSCLYSLSGGSAVNTGAVGNMIRCGTTSASCGAATWQSSYLLNGNPRTITATTDSTGVVYIQWKMKYPSSGNTDTLTATVVHNNATPIARATGDFNVTAR